MILFDGALYESTEQNRLLEMLEERINATRATLSSDPETVIRAVEVLRQRVLAGEFTAQITALLSDSPTQYLRLAADFMNGDSLRKRLHRELGENYNISERITPR